MATTKNQIINALVMALEEIHHPGSARAEGADITILIEDALAAVREMPTRTALEFEGEHYPLT